MKRLILRISLIAATLMALLLIAATSWSGAALADPPVHFIHIYRTKDYYDRLRTTSTQNLNKLVYQGGKVMLDVKAYAIYWGPSGHKIKKSYRTLVNRYFKDIGSTKFYKIVTQYFQNPGQQHITQNSTFGGQWVDTTNAYPHPGTAGNPLTDDDIVAEVQRAINHNGWPTGLGSEFFVFTAKGIESCADSVDCTPGTAHPAYCAYHSAFGTISQPSIYANMPYAGTWKNLQNNCNHLNVSPNNNEDADLEISVASHEHFEAVTDPLPGPGFYAWIDLLDPSGGEIGDKCAFKFGHKAADGSNLTLNGHPYLIQLEYSNAYKSNAGGCTKK